MAKSAAKKLTASATYDRASSIETLVRISSAIAIVLSAVACNRRVIVEIVNLLAIAPPSFYALLVQDSAGFFEVRCPRVGYAEIT